MYPGRGKRYTKLLRGHYYIRENKEIIEHGVKSFRCILIHLHLDEGTEIQIIYRKKKAQLQYADR